MVINYLYRPVTIGVLILGVLACATPPPRETPAPVEERSVPVEEDRVALGGSHQPHSERYETPARTSRPAAAQDLSQRAHAASQKQDWVQAAALLERALRIAPQDAGLWQQLAQVRLAQGDFRQAESLGQKAYHLARDENTRYRSLQVVRQAQENQRRQGR